MQALALVTPAWIALARTLALQRCDERRNFAGVDGVRGLAQAGGQVWNDLGGEKDGGSVQQDDVATRPEAAGKDGGKDRSILRGAAAVQLVERGAAQAEIFGSESPVGHGAFTDFGNVTAAADRELVDAESGMAGVGHGGFAIDNEGAAGAEQEPWRRRRWARDGAQRRP